MSAVSSNDWPSPRVSLSLRHRATASAWRQASVSPSASSPSTGRPICPLPRSALHALRSSPPTGKRDGAGKPEATIPKLGCFAGHPFHQHIEAGLEGLERPLLFEIDAKRIVEAARRRVII